MFAPRCYLAASRWYIFDYLENRVVKIKYSVYAYFIDIFY